MLTVIIRVGINEQHQDDMFQNANLNLRIKVRCRDFMECFTMNWQQSVADGWT